MDVLTRYTEIAKMVSRKCNLMMVRQ